MRAAPRPSLPRQAWADNLRISVIAAVIVAHVSATYIVDVPWYYEERSATPIAQALLSALIGPGVLYAMGALFLVAGLWTPRSLRSKGTRRFIKDRLMRLGVPLVVTTWGLVPLTALIGALAEGEVGVGDLAPFLAYEAREVDTGVMWFVAVLLLFSLAYAGLRALRPVRPASRRVPMASLGSAVVVIAAATFSVRMAWPLLSVTPGHLNLWEWPSMAVLFAIGVAAAEQGWLEPVPDRLRRLSGWIAAAALALETVFFAAVALTGDDRLLGGWYPQALIEPTIDAFLVPAMSLWLVAWFQRHADRQGARGRAAGRASFAAYAFHPIVIVGIAVAVRPVLLPAEVKFVAVAALGVFLSFWLGAFLLRSRLLARLL